MLGLPTWQTGFRSRSQSPILTSQAGKGCEAQPVGEGVPRVTLQQSPPADAQNADGLWK